MLFCNYIGFYYLVGAKAILIYMEWRPTAKVFGKDLGRKLYRQILTLSVLSQKPMYRPGNLL